MPHPRSKQISKIPQFSKIVNSAPALQSPIISENEAIRGLPAPEQQPFNPRVAMYTLAFVGVLVGGLTVGVKSKEIMERWEQRKKYEELSPHGKIADLKKLRENLILQREKLEDQIAVIRIQQEDEQRVKRDTS